MGVYDVVTCEAACPGCSHSQRWRIQYHHGYCRLHEYRIGDSICWFDPPGRPAPLGDEGENVGGLVAVPGAIEGGCAQCGRGDGAVLYLRDNVFERAEITLTGPGEEVTAIQASPGWMRFWSRRVAGSRNEDRLEISCRGRRWTVAVADGAGGMAGGALAAGAATEAMVALGADLNLDPDAWCERLHQLDREIEADANCGETTLVVVQIEDGELWGASVGDSGALLITPDALIDLTAHQIRKPLLGSGTCRATAIPRRPLAGRLLVATDGLLKYLPRAALHALAQNPDLRAAIDASIAAVTLPSGSLQDDVAVVIGEPAAS